MHSDRTRQLGRKPDGNRPERSRTCFFFFFADVSLVESSIEYRPGGIDINMVRRCLAFRPSTVPLIAWLPIQVVRFIQFFILRRRVHQLVQTNSWNVLCLRVAHHRTRRDSKFPGFVCAFGQASGSSAIGCAAVAAVACQGQHPNRLRPQEMRSHLMYAQETCRSPVQRKISANTGVPHALSHFSSQSHSGRHGGCLSRGFFRTTQNLSQLMLPKAGSSHRLAEVQLERVIS